VSKCPTCFHELPPQVLKLLCTGDCPTSVSALATRERGYEAATKPDFDARLPVCPRCKQPSEVEACPTCFGPVPADWRSYKVTCVVMAGARATGKSLLLAVMKEQFEQFVEQFHHCALVPLGRTAAVFHERYTRPLYEERNILPPTASMRDAETTAREPLIFTFQEHTPAGPRTRALVLRDVAGEDLEARGSRDEMLGFFSRADAVLGLLDPMKVEEIRLVLQGILPYGNSVGGDGVAVIEHVIRLMGASNPGTPTHIPLALALSKADTLQSLRHVEGNKWRQIMGRPGSPLRRDPSMRTPHFDQTDGDLLHCEVAALLDEFGASRVAHFLSTHASRSRYFAVSALGAPPNGETLHAGGIAPFRVVDPLKWILAVTA
jgi:hypothetical protein